MSAAASSSSSPSGSRASLDDSATTIVTSSNGKSSSNHSDDEDTWAPISTMSSDEIRTELARVREERDTFESQYRSLLSKLTTMRATLGDRLRQDAEELDRREGQIETLTAKVSELESSCSTLREELVASHSETDRLSTEVDTLRKGLAAKEEELSKSEGKNGGTVGRLERERELHELVERIKLDSSNWQTSALEETAKRQSLETQLHNLSQELELARSSEQHHRAVAERESSSAANLSRVLAEFQSTQDAELSRTLLDSQTQISTLTSSLEEYRVRAETAESQVTSSATLASQAETLQSQVREKNLLIGKLRHEAVILNEHLTEALRRLRNDQSDTSVDRRLVTNLLLKFLDTPRTDGKRWEMLSLIGGVLGWGEEEREMAGLQRGAGGGKTAGRRSEGGVKRDVGSAGGVGVGGADESFGNLFVEFLLSEAESGKQKEEGEAVVEGGEVLPKRLLSPTMGAEMGSPSKGVGVNGDDAAGKGGGLGSYFGLSRGGKK